LSKDKPHKAQNYAKGGFPDLNLQQHIENCKKQKKCLRHVGDPDARRKKV